MSLFDILIQGSNNKGFFYANQYSDQATKTLLQRNPPVLNWGCRLTQFDLDNDGKTAVCRSQSKSGNICRLRLICCNIVHYNLKSIRDIVNKSSAIGSNYSEFRGHNNTYSGPEGQSLLGATVFEVM